MSEQTRPDDERAAPATPSTAEGATATAVREAPPRLDSLPPYKVLLHNDDSHEMGDVVDVILELTPLKRDRAFEAMMTAHRRGLSLLLVTHKERAELYEDQFRSKGLIVTIEPDA